MERGKPRHIESNSDDIYHEEDSDADCVDSLGKPELINFRSDEKKKEEEDDIKEDEENNKDESDDEDYIDEDEVQQVNPRGTLLDKPISSNNIIPRKGTTTKKSRVILELKKGEPKYSDIIKILDKSKWSMSKPDSHNNVKAVGGYKLKMGKPDSTEELEVAKNTKWSMSKPDSHDDIKVVGSYKLKIGKPDSTE